MIRVNGRERERCLCETLSPGGKMDDIGAMCGMDDIRTRGGEVFFGSSSRGVLGETRTKVIYVVRLFTDWVFFVSLYINIWKLSTITSSVEVGAHLCPR